MIYKVSILITILFTFLTQLSISQIVNVKNTSEFSTALNNAKAGTTIVLADGLYSKSGGFKTPSNIHGNAQNPIVIKGSSKAIISSGNLSSGNAITLNENDYWQLEGFSVYNSKKGIVTDNCNYCKIKNISVVKVGDEAIHLRTFSSYNTITNCFIDSTGCNPSSASSGFAEGIYIGSANSNWATYTNGNPDTCNYNIITYNSFGNSILSENIDIKEGTKGGIISNNTFNGKGCNGKNSADSWVDVKGNNYIIKCNSGKNIYSGGAGFQTHIVWAGTGDNNTFNNNSIEMNTNASYGIYITKSSSKGTANNNIVCDNNQITPSNYILSNINLSVCNNDFQQILTSIGQFYSENEVVNYSNNQIEFNTTLEHISIYDLSGNVIYEFKNKQQVEISDLKQGIYIVKTLNNNQLKIFKFIKN